MVLVTSMLLVYVEIFRYESQSWCPCLPRVLIDTERQGQKGHLCGTAIFGNNLQKSFQNMCVYMRAFVCMEDARGLWRLGPSTAVEAGAASFGLRLPLNRPED